MKLVFNLLFRLMAFVAIITISIPILGMILQGGAWGSITSAVIMLIVSLFYFSLLLPSFVLVICGRPRSKVLRSGVLAATFLAFVAIGFLSIGLMQDLQGIYCSGLFGSSSSCADAAEFTVFAVLFATPLFGVLIAIFIIILAFGMRNELALRKERSKAAQ